MAGNLPIQIPYKLGQQPMLPQAGMPNMTLPPVSVPVQSIFTPVPIVDINKDIDISSVFGEKRPETPNRIKKALDWIKREEGTTDKEMEEENKKIVKFLEEMSFKMAKEEIRRLLLEKTNNEPLYAHSSLYWLNKDNISAAKALLQNENFSSPENIWQILSILGHIDFVNEKDKENKAFRLSLIPKFIEKFGKTKDIDAGTFMEVYANITPENEKLYFPDSSKGNTELEKTKEKIRNLLLNNSQDAELIINITGNIDENNSEIAEKICQNESFINRQNIYYIPNFLSRINEINKNLALSLVTNDKCEIFRQAETCRLINDILRDINTKNIEFANWICLSDESKDFRTGKDVLECCRNISNLIKHYEDCPDFINLICKTPEGQCFRSPEAINHISEIVKVYQFSPNFANWICNGAETQSIRKPENIKYFKDIIYAVNDENIDFAKSLLIDKEYEDLRTSSDFQYIVDILENTNKNNLDEAKELCTNKKISKKLIGTFLKYEIDYNVYEKLIKKTGEGIIDTLDEEDIALAIDLQTFHKVKNINEVPRTAKKKFLQKLVNQTTGPFFISKELKEDFPLIPTNKKEYCELLPQLVRSLGIETRTLNENEISEFNNNINDLGDNLANLSDSEFTSLQISQEFSRNDFIQIVLGKTKELSETEKQKVFAYFGFDLKENSETESGYTITGYPVNLDNGKQLSQIEDRKIKSAIENLRNDVIRFSENNGILSSNPQIEMFLNEILKYAPELHTIIGRLQHGMHDFDIMKHSLKVMQKIVQDEGYKNLSESDKKIMLLAALYHDITKFEGHCDKTHAKEGSFDGYFLAKKFNLSEEENFKLYTLIKNHEWLEAVDNAANNEQVSIMRSVAFDLRQNNIFDMSLMFTHADLKAVKADNSFHGNEISSGTQKSLGELTDIYGKQIKEYIRELKKTQPLLPVTKIPSADIIKSKVTTINADGSTNIKGLYIDKEGLPIIKFNEVENWEDLGFQKGTISIGIKTILHTGNIKFFVHGLDYEEQLVKFDAFSLPDSDALLSVSYADSPESKYEFYRPQGVILYADTNYIYGGGKNNGGSGWKKSTDLLKRDYILEEKSYADDRVFISNLIKEATGMNDEEYINFLEQNKNKSMLEIEPVDTREKIIKALATINSQGYNEHYVSNPKPMATFASAIEGKIGNPVEYFEKNKERLSFLTKFSKERNLPRIVFGE